MSRNFELLTQIEHESDGEESRAQAATERTPKTALPSRDSADTGGDEMLRLVQRVFLSPTGFAPSQIVFCGVEAENGSSSVCASAARTLAANSTLSVCLVDANLRSPGLTDLFRATTTTPFSGKADSMRAQCVQLDENLWLAGTTLLSDENGALLPVSELKRRLAQLHSVFEYVLIDAPGAGVCGDAAHLGQIVDAAILVIEANSTRRLTARKAKDTLEAAGVRLLGTVLHNRSFPIPEGLYKTL